MRRLPALLLVTTSLAMSGCKNKSDQPTGWSTEQEYLQHRLVDLKDALATRSESKATIACMSDATRAADNVRAEMQQLCTVAVPTLLLEKAIADAKRNQAKFPPEMADMTCTQLFAHDAFKTIAAHPPTDAHLVALVQDYTQLCPKQVAKFRAM